MLSLSGAVLVFSIIRAIGLYYAIAGQKYEAVEGTCIGVSSKPLRKYYTVKLMDDAGIENSLRVGKQAKLRIGFRYRFYFRKCGRLSVGSEYFDTALSSDQFLGFEELGEFMKPKEAEMLDANDEKIES